MKLKLKKLLRDLSRVSEFQKFYLEGGSALSLIFSIPRNDSWDLDFTVEPDLDIEKFTRDIQSLGIGYRIIEISNQDVITTISIGNDEAIFNLDLVKVPFSVFSSELQQVRIDNDIYNINVHTIEDIFCEKICCLFMRRKLNDLIDINQILSFERLDVNNLIRQLQRKLRVKEIQVSIILKSFSDIITDFEYLLNKNKNSKFTMNKQDIFDYVKNILTKINNENRTPT